MEAPPFRVLLVDDEPPIVELLTGYLIREGWQVFAALDGLAALDAIRDHQPDAVVLDVMLPGLDGVEVCRRLRLFSDAYVLMLTARGEEIDRIVGLTVGADDYLVKPFSPREVVARLKAFQRRPRRSVDAGAGTTGTGGPRTPGAEAGVAAGVLADGIHVDPARRTVRVDDEPVDLTALEFNLLAALARRPGIVAVRAELLESVWGPAYAGDDHLLDVHIANLRRKLHDEPAAPRFIETVRGVGFRLRERPAKAG